MLSESLLRRGSGLGARRSGLHGELGMSICYWDVYAVRGGSSVARSAMSELNRLNRLALKKQLNVNEVFGIESKFSLECQEIPGIISLNSVSLSVFVVARLVVGYLKTLDRISLNLKILNIVSNAKGVVHR